MLVLVLASPFTSGQSIIHVDLAAASGGDGSPMSPFATIQDGINAASSGDTVLVAAGTYVENLDFLGKDIALESASGAVGTTIDGSGAPTGVIRIDSGEVAASVMGFTISGGTHWGGIYVQGAGVEIRHCLVTGNSAFELVTGTAGGVHIDSPVSCVVDQCQFVGNTGSSGVGVGPSNGVAGGAGGVQLAGGGSHQVVACSFSQNVGYPGSLLALNQNVAGAGGVVVTSGSVELSDCTFTNNTGIDANQTCGGIGVVGGIATVRRCSFVNNVGAGIDGPGAALLDSGTSMFIECSFVGNQASPTDTWSPTAGGAVSVEGGTHWFVGCEFRGNVGGMFGAPSVLACSNGGLCSTTTPHATLINCTIVGNVNQEAFVSYTPEAIVALGPCNTVDIRSCIIWGNTADDGSVASLATVGGGVLTVEYSCVEAGFAGTANIMTDPQFANPLLGDYHLLPTSPCIDTGEPGGPGTPVLRGRRHGRGRVRVRLLRRLEWRGGTLGRQQ